MNTQHISDTFKRESRYIVFKLTDVEKYFDPKQKQELHNLGIHMEFRRCFSNSKPQRQVVVVESDWPEYEIIWKMIEDRMKCKTNELIDDAMRYRWLRENRSVLMRFLLTGFFRNGTLDEVDAAIDEAIAKAGETAAREKRNSSND